MKKVYETAYGRNRVTVHWNREWEEYRVRTYVDGRANDAADYFDSDKESAIAHADHVVRLDCAE